MACIHRPILYIHCMQCIGSVIFSSVSFVLFHHACRTPVRFWTIRSLLAFTMRVCAHAFASSFWSPLTPHYFRFCFNHLSSSDGYFFCTVRLHLCCIHIPENRSPVANMCNEKTVSSPIHRNKIGVNVARNSFKISNTLKAALCFSPKIVA